MGRRQHQDPGVLRTKGKRPRWYIRHRDNVLTDAGKTNRREVPRTYLGYCDEMTKTEAKKLKDEIMGTINRPQIIILSQVKFAEVLKVYEREHLPNLRDTTRRTQSGILKTHFADLGKLRMCDLDAMAIQRWLSGMALSYSTKKSYLALLRVIWGKAEEWGYTQQRFPRGSWTCGPKRSVKGRQMPTAEQLRRLLMALEDPFRAMAEIALFTGLRISEIRGLQWGDLDDGRLIVRRRVDSKDGVDTTKNGQERIFDLRPIDGIFSRIEHSDEWVFFHAKAGYANCRHRMAEARKAAGITIPRFSWHHLRACFNTLVRSNGADAVDRQALLGHSDERMNAVYVMQTAEDVQRRGDLMLAVQAAIMGATKGVQ